MQQTKEAAIRKRSQISKANRTMFFWVAGASAFVGIALVVSIFLIQKIAFNERVLAAKDETVTRLNDNNKNITELESQVRALDSNELLINAKANPGDQAIQVILDALPSEANSLALGASLQNKLLNNIPGLTLESLQVDPVAGIESLSSVNDTGITGSTGTDGQSQITFKFAASGDEAALKQVLIRLEHSIRAIDVQTLHIESQGTARILSVTGRAFYEPTRIVELKDKVIK
jgi:cell division protein FtsL